MRWQYVLATAASLVSHSSAIFSDDAFHTDYHQALLGIPQPQNTFFHKPKSSSNASLLYTVSDRAVLGAVNPRDGSLIWRQALAGQPIESTTETYLIAGDADGRITSGYQSTVSSWDALDGRLNWVYDFGHAHLVRGIQTIPTLTQGAENIIQDIVAVAGPGKECSTAKVVRLAGDGTAARWEYQDKSDSHDTLFAIATSSKHVYYITKSSGVLSGGKAKVVVLDSSTGKEIGQHNVAIDAEPLSSSWVVGSGSEGPFMLSSEKPYKTFKFNLLGNSKSTTLTLEDKGDEIEKLTVHHVGGPHSAPHFLIHVHGKTKHWAEVFHVGKSGDIRRAYVLPATSEVSVFAATWIGSTTYFARITETEVSLYSSESHGQLGRWSRSASHLPDSLETLHAATEVSARGAGAIALRVAISSSVSGWSLLRNGEQAWNRPEPLAYITKAVWADDTEATLLAHEIEVEAASNPITAYVHRWSRHLQDLKHLPRHLLGLPRKMLQTGDDTGKSARQTLGGSKLILASSSKGKILALDASNAGAIRWSVTLSEPGKPIPEVIHLSTEASRLTVYLSDGQMLVLDTTNGQVIDQLKAESPFTKIIELPGKPASTIVKVSLDGKPDVFSDLAPAVPDEGSIVVTINKEGEAVGWSIGASVRQIWTIRPENGAKINDVISRSPLDPVASIGQVLGDRSVLYKYINPNIAVLTALSPTALTVYVINAVTGAVLHTAVHDGVLAAQPISAVLSEHRVIYSFTNKNSATSGLTSQVIVSELYESVEPNERGLLQAKTNYSSFSPDAGAAPYVVSKAFTIPEPLSYLAVSQTIQGITSRQFLAYLMESKSVVGIPSDVLNARRPVDRDPTAGELEEGLRRYSPILDLDPKFFLSHAREVIGIKELMTAPTLLESTSFVFAFGHDIFGTQVAPSNTFDVLGKGFKRVQLVLTVVALYLGVLALRPIARRKIVEKGWL